MTIVIILSAAAGIVALVLVVLIHATEPARPSGTHETHDQEPTAVPVEPDSPAGRHREDTVEIVPATWGLPAGHYLTTSLADTQRMDLPEQQK